MSARRAGQDLEARVVAGAADDRDDEVEEGCLVAQRTPVIGAAEMSAVVRLTISSRPSVSTTPCRLRPTVFLAAS